MYEIQFRSLDMVEKKKFLPLSEFDRLSSNSAYSNLYCTKAIWKSANPAWAAKLLVKVFFSKKIFCD